MQVSSHHLQSLLRRYLIDMINLVNRCYDDGESWKLEECSKFTVYILQRSREEARRPFEISLLESIKTEVINLKAAIVSTDTKTTVNGHTATPVTPDDQSKMGKKINGVPEPSNQKLHDRMDSDIQAVRKIME